MECSSPNFKMNKGLIKKIPRFVEDEYKKPTGRYSFESYEFHFVSAMGCSGALVKMGGNDGE